MTITSHVIGTGSTPDEALADAASKATQHKVHDTLPSGFAYANAFQAEEYAATGLVHGASKAVFVRARGGMLSCCALSGVGACDDAPHVDLAIRFRPPRTINDIRSPLGISAAKANSNTPLEAAEWYIAQYNLGWQASTRVDRTGQSSEAWNSGVTNHAWDDGYLDHATGRAKWHLTYCSDHDNCGEG